jgi:hypothetical protein
LGGKSPPESCYSTGSWKKGGFGIGEDQRFLGLLAIFCGADFFWNLSAGQKFSDFKKINALF